MDYKQIDELVNQHRSNIVAMIQDLVDIPTENNPPAGFEEKGQEYIKRVFGDIGLDIDIFAPDEIEDYEINDAFLHGQIYDNGRKNVVGTWQGSGKGRSLVLCGHMDVAPKEPLPWTVCEPYTSVVKEGKIYGRGTADMKGGLAVGVMAVRLLKGSGFVPKGTVTIESVVDEEYASGNGTIASRFRGHNADFGIIMEPSGLAICPANVGSIMIQIKIKGSPGMPYTGEDTFNVAYGLGDMLGVIKRFDVMRSRAPYPPIWENSPQKRMVVITKVKAGEVKPHGQLGAPSDAFIECSIQSYPGESKKDIINCLSEYIEGNFKYAASVEYIPLYNYVEPANTDANYAGVRLLKDAAVNYMDDVSVTAAPFPCDLFAFEKYGKMPGVIFGPVGGNLHAPDEWVDIDSVLTLTKTLMMMITQWCGEA